MSLLPPYQKKQQTRKFLSLLYRILLSEYQFLYFFLLNLFSTFSDQNQNVVLDAPSSVRPIK